MSFRAFKDSDLKEALERKDYAKLKVLLSSTIKSDPTFSTQEVSALCNIFQKNVPEIFEKKIELGYEEIFPPEQWDKRYFSKLLYWLQQNFAKERIDYIKEVGKTVYSQSAYDGKDKSDHPRTAPEKEVNRLQWKTGVVIITAAVILVLTSVALYLMVKK